MSRVGSSPIPVPTGVEVRIAEGVVSAKGKAGAATYAIPKEVELQLEDNVLRVVPLAQDKRSRQIWGTTRANLARMVAGVNVPFEKRLEIEGVGFRAQIQGRDVLLSLGYSHEVRYAIPEGIEVTAVKPTELVVSGIDCHKVGQVAAQLRAWRVPDPYKAKGVRYAGEYIRRKEGKKK